MQIKLAIIIAFSFVSQSFLLSAQNFPNQPNPPKIVNDFAGMLKSSELQKLERKLVAYNDTSSNQIAIVTINSTDGYPISKYSFELGEKWGIGGKGKDNGILLLVAFKDRDMFIATGYGLEDVVPDALAKRIVENYIKPNFRNEDYYTGLNEATDVLIDLTTGRYTADDLPDNDGSPFVSYVFFLAFVLIFVFVSFAKSRGKQHHYSKNGKRIYPNDFGRASGGGWWLGGGGGSSGGSSGGGGFGGFGGGSFGGGGAGGSW